MIAETLRIAVPEFANGIIERAELYVKPACISAFNSRLHIFIDFGQLCSSKPTTHVHGNRTVVFMISATRFQAGQHP
jgi:hypothetical protein